MEALGTGESQLQPDRQVGRRLGAGLSGNGAEQIIDHFSQLSTPSLGETSGEVEPRLDTMHTELLQLSLQVETLLVLCMPGFWKQ